MIWRAVRHTTSVEFAAWTVVLLLVLLLSLFGVDSTQLDELELDSGIVFVLFVSLCLLIYRLRYGRL